MKLVADMRDDAVPDPPDAAELLHVEMHELAGPVAFVADDAPGRLEARQTGQPLAPEERDDPETAPAFPAAPQDLPPPVARQPTRRAPGPRGPICDDGVRRVAPPPLVERLAGHADRPCRRRDRVARLDPDEGQQWPRGGQACILVDADGSTCTAPGIAFPSVRVTADDRKKLTDELRSGIEKPMAGARGMAADAPSGFQMPKIELIEPEWQTHKPPLVGTVILVDGKNRAWVPTLGATPTVARFDLLDAEGRLVVAIALPDGSALLGYGKGVVYVSRKDEDDLLYVQRYALP